MTRKGNVFVFSGPSGVGKGTLIKEILPSVPQLKLSVSATTRKPRSNEIDGENYFFTSRDIFVKQIENNEFLEWAEFTGNYYGTYEQTVKDAIVNGEDIILEIEVQGAMQIRKRIPEAILIFILPPTLQELEKRLHNRNTETKESIAKRLAVAESEFELIDKFDYKVTNKELCQATKELLAIINDKLQKV